MTTVTKGRLKWASLNSAQWLLMALGLVGQGWAWNLFAFSVWLGPIAFGIATLALLVSIDPKTGKPRAIVKIKRAVPVWVDATLDTVMMIILVSLGHWFYGFMTGVLMFVYTLYFSMQEKYPEKLVEGSSTSDTYTI